MRRNINVRVSIPCQWTETKNRMKWKKKKKTKGSERKCCTRSCNTGKATRGLKRRLTGRGRVNKCFTPRHRTGLLYRPCGPSCVGAGLRQRKSVAHSLQRRKQMLILGQRWPKKMIFRGSQTYASRQCDCTCEFVTKKDA